MPLMSTRLVQSPREAQEAVQQVRREFMRHLLLTMLLVLSWLPAGAAEPWEMLPPTPAPMPAERSGQVSANGISIYYAVYGRGSPVILLHGGLANSDYWGNQIQALASHHSVIVMDSRGHGRSTRDLRPYGYDLMADDVVALMDALKVPRAEIVGWSDGGILGLDLAIRHRGRVGKILAFAANTVPSGVKPDVEKNPTFAAFIERAGHEYQSYSATPKQYDAFVEQISRCGRISRTGRTRSSRRSRLRCWWWTAITTRRSSASTPSTSPRRSQALDC